MKSKNIRKFFLLVISFFLIASSTFYLNNQSFDEGKSIRDKKKNNIPSSAAQSDGIPISTAFYFQKYPDVCDDGEGGAIITWRDQRGGYYSDTNVYAQRINRNGKVNWTHNGIKLTPGVVYQRYLDQFRPKICSDGDGGAIITWEEDRTEQWDGDIFAQRVNSSGDVLWTENGTDICTIAKKFASSPQICSDGNGGAIIIWEDERGADVDIYAQRVNSSGEIQWSENGVAVCTETDEQANTQICSDGSGGAILTWEDDRGFGTKIYAQRINSTGGPEWTPNGVIICTYDPQYPGLPQICSDGDNGAIITWRDTGYGDIHAQKINSTGDVQWVVDGVEICTFIKSTVIPRIPQICSDGNGGAIITWEDAREDYHDIYAQRVNSSGDVKWAIDGIGICTADLHDDYPQICSDGNGGVIITWTHLISSWKHKIYAQRINSTGNMLWRVNGEAICAASSSQMYSQIVNVGVGEAIIAWQDSSQEQDTDIYAQKIASNGDIEWLYTRPLVDDGGDDDDDDGEAKAIPSYDAFILICILSITLITLTKKRWKAIKNLKNKN
jgi:hypothetical protein